MSTEFWLALSNIEGVGSTTIKKIYQYIPDLNSKNLNDHIKELKIVIKKSDIIQKITDEQYFIRKLKESKKHIEYHNTVGIDVVDISSNYYPRLLRLIDDPPTVLYCKGNKELLRDDNKIAVVGTRNPTELGMKAAIQIAKQFCKRGFIIVSGLALGIDTAGHIGALKENGKTIAVLAGGLDKVYPKENTDIANKIVNSGGLLISETPIGGLTFRNSFVKRDRIQSGLSLGVCPVQTPLKGGTQHTIKFSKKQKRVLFCPEPLEPYEVEATQGIFELINKKVAETISNENDYEKIINLLRDRLESLISEEEQLISIKTHEINKQVENVVVYSRNIEKTQLNLFEPIKDDQNKEIKEQLDMLMNQVVRIAKLINLSDEELFKRFTEKINDVN